MPKSIHLVTILFILSAQLCMGCKDDVPAETDTIINGQRIILFSGYEWVVDSSEDNKKGPGPN